MGLPCALALLLLWGFPILLLDCSGGCQFAGVLLSDCYLLFDCSGVANLQGSCFPTAI